MQKSFITSEPVLCFRAQVIQPLKFTGTLGKVDIVADVTSGGPTGQSGAIRVAVARALRSFVDIDMVEKMRIGKHRQGSHKLWKSWKT